MTLQRITFLWIVETKIKSKATFEHCLNLLYKMYSIRIGNSVYTLYGTSNIVLEYLIDFTYINQFYFTIERFFTRR